MRLLTSLPGRLLLLLLVWIAPLAAETKDRNYKTTPVMRHEVRTLVQMLEYFHYNKGAVTAKDYPQVITDYMAELDPQRLFFTAQDEASLRQQYGPRLETDLAYLGNIDAAFAIFRLYESRVQTRVSWLLEQLKTDYDFTSEEIYAPDRTKSPWPASQTEADDLWRRRIKFELLQDLIADKPVTDAKQTVAKRYERMVKNVADIEDSDIQELYLTSLTKLYDPHSNYFSATTLEDFSIQMRLSLYGIGAILGLEDDGYCVVREIVPGGPADLSGKIKVNDKITAVQQPGGENIEVIGMKLRRIVEQVRGPKDTKVILTIQPAIPAADGKPYQVTITRDIIRLDSARAFGAIYEVPDQQGIINPVGVITLNSFYGPSEDASQPDAPRNTASQDVAELIGKMKTQGIKALVIDLRRNGGGLLSEAVALSGLFIDSGPVVQVRDSMGRLVVDNDTQAGVSYAGPLAVLTSRYSASASEIFAGAMQNYGRAVVIGDSSTHGKGTVQAVLEMKNYLPRLAEDPGKTGAAKLTIQKFYLPNGASTQKKGVVPDITLPSIEDYLPIGEADLPHALMWDEIRTTSFDGHPVSPTFLTPLIEASKHRQDSLEEFSLLRRHISWFKAKQEEKNVSLNLARRLEQKKSDETFKKELDAERETLAKGNFVKHDVKLDAVIAAEAKAPKKTPAADTATSADEGDTDALDEKAAARLDIHLRETLRVVTDALRLSKDPQFWAKGTAPITTPGSNGG